MRSPPSRTGGAWRPERRPTSVQAHRSARPPDTLPDNMETRRRFLTKAGATAAGVLVTPALSTELTGSAAFAARKVRRFGSGRFPDGVISGDPTPSAITLWTRVDDVEGAGSVGLEVATDKAFRHVVARKELATSGASFHTVKARISGLEAHEQYYYRFATRTTHSAVGRARTALPADSEQPVRFAFFSCQDYTHGFYNAHAALAEEDDLDFV